MNERELTRLDQVIGSQAEIKAELVSLTKQVERINGTLLNHFVEDKKWMAEHDVRETAANLEAAKKKGEVEGKASVRKSEMAIIGTIAGLLPMLGYAIVFLLQ